MFEMGYLCPIKYETSDTYDSRKIKNNSTGQGYDERSLFAYNQSQDIISKIVDTVKNSNAKHKLIFTQFRDESEEVIARLYKSGITCKEISGKTKNKDREQILRDFRVDNICVVNVGVLVAGWDFPELDHIVFARPTKSLRLYSQICGRGLRIAEGKKYCKITDLCDNVKRFGEINTFTIEDISDGKELWRLKSNVGYLTGINLNTGTDLEQRQMTTKKEKEKVESGELIIPFGKYSGTNLQDIDIGYMEWCVKNFDKKNKWRKIFIDEIERRRKNI
jgi:DNA repair protein RadD